ncbi:OmpA family protein [Leisingera sp. JC1]|uniref:OmpA family protein n=1 Tax=Leisingera sp. JC1 TaxID=1855282 RepID=UPI000802F963|nr:OmpA family protein [Leisingera sp. JC1]OBY26210.1 hypothetical protein A9D60_19345 [Leisingera sp. JC1]
MIRKIAWAGLMLSVAACTDATGFSAQQQKHFGDAAATNAAVMKGDRSYAIQLAGRFAKEVPNTINFDFDSARLDQEARAVLDRQAHWIKQFPEVRFRVFGHTDAVGSNAYNKSLGLRRARAAVNYLVSRGISRNRLEAVVSFGETQPLIPTPDRERRNRRTVTEVSGFLKRHPTLLDGKYAKVIYREYIESAIPPTSLTITTIDEG